MVCTSKDDVRRKVEAQNTTTGIIVGCVIAAILFAASIVSILISRELELVIQQILALANLKFSEVVQEGKVKSKSLIAELFVLQAAFIEMIMVFKDKLQISRELQSLRRSQFDSKNQKPVDGLQ
ncbi:hypothetical protein BC829DRAFT_388051 [Chytridium lagenaria]|nr:hypothetical protein BC829DRAFT_388051 [Chytridium lagenaria]